MVDSGSQGTGAGLAHLNVMGFTTPPCDRRHPGQGPQGMIISRLDGLVSLCEQRGEDNPSHPRQGAQDCRIALLGLLPRCDLPPGEFVDQDVEATRDVFDLVVHQVQPLGDGSDVSLGCIGCAWFHGQRRTLQDLHHIRGCDAAGYDMRSTTGNLSISNGTNSMSRKHLRRLGTWSVSVMAH